MAPALPASLLPRLLVWIPLAAIGLTGWFHRAPTMAPAPPGPVSGAAELETADALERQADQQRRVAELLDRFAGAQLVSQYWGTWVSSLETLDIAQHRDLQPQLRTSPITAELTVLPDAGSSRYLGKVQRVNERTSVVLCRRSLEAGSADGWESGLDEPGCPAGWEPFEEAALQVAGS
ncbi:hypothetical protein EVJ50_12725 [Synechococcus sp. RSCCF101]|uniref:hypothetical protein n=1 Tax=Synechococcus sp. RSCCF101 TaxID=2511069 RepID=UPI0012455940|nr:hypothetical protein [Synechococcus sp. RSCCF101]QEY32962.1 hypothetical protein EVJ50_12725 [Synechococcus sp. RSCCF101]